MWVININKKNNAESRYFIFNSNNVIEVFRFEDVENIIKSEGIKSIYIHINGFSVFQGTKVPKSLTKSALIQEYKFDNLLFYGAIKWNDFLAEIVKWYSLELKIDDIFIGDGLGVMNLKHNDKYLFGTTIFSVGGAANLVAKKSDAEINYNSEYISSMINTIHSLKTNESTLKVDYIVGKIKIIALTKLHNFLNFSINNKNALGIISVILIIISISLSFWANSVKSENVIVANIAEKKAVKSMKSVEKYKSIVNELTSYGIENRNISTLLLNDIFEKMPKSFHVINIDVYPEVSNSNTEKKKNVYSKKYSNSFVLTGFYNHFELFEKWMDNIKENSSINRINFLEFKQVGNLIQFRVQIYF